jgi:two-component system sensor histidine kinase AlgZ
MNSRNGVPAEDTLFLPDFCAVRMVLAIILVGELLAFTVALAPTRVGADWWSDMAFSSLFIQWVGLSSAAVLCISRGWLKRIDNSVAGVLSYALVLLITLVLSEIAFWIVVSPIVELDPSQWSAPLQTYAGKPVPSFPEHFQTQQHWEFLLRNLGISAIVSAVALRYFYVQHQWKANLESETRARIQALQSRIRPHFLFNSMNTIASLTRTDPTLAEQVTEDLADLFRVSLGDASVPVRLERELEVCRQYLNIEKQRLGDRLEDRWRVDDLPGDALIPGLSLQPLLENAVYHGIEPVPGGGVIEVSGGREGATLWVRIANSVSGDSAVSPRVVGNQMAQENVDKRLGAFFGKRASFSVNAASEEYAVELRFPYVTASENETGPVR